MPGPYAHAQKSPAERIDHKDELFYSGSLGPCGRLALAALEEDGPVALQKAQAYALLGILIELRTGPR